MVITMNKKGSGALLIALLIVGAMFIYFYNTNIKDDIVGTSCQAWEFHNEDEMNKYYDEKYGESWGGIRRWWRHTCPSGYVCTDETYKSTMDLAEGHFIENPAYGTCKKASTGGGLL